MMAVVSVDKDHGALTLTVTSEFDASIERIWQVWADPRQLERWWGPPTYPATVVEHHLDAGGRVSYFMTGPEGDVHRGWWRIVSVDPPFSLVAEDGFADDGGEPRPDMPTLTFTVQLSESSPGKTTMVVATTFPSIEAMQQLEAMGMEEGSTLAAGQIDAILTAVDTV
jgi:uncharacterized protein YndB with AHSA1/START domain